MVPRRRGIFVSAIVQLAWLVCVFLLWPVVLFAQPDGRNVACRNDLSLRHRNELANQLRKITGWSDLEFEHGRLRAGTTKPVGGSHTARELLKTAVFGTTFIALEDASRRSDVTFSRVIPAKWLQETTDHPPAVVVQIDFADFDYVFGDAPALEAFNAGWVLLHELDHIVNDTVDATLKDELGECENHINRMRQECNLPLRSEYFFTFLPVTKDSLFNNRLVRLAFEHQLDESGKKKRYWLVWDVTRVGGLPKQTQIAALR